MVIATVADGLQEDYAKNIGRIAQKSFDDFDIKEGEIIEVVSGDRKVGVILKPLEEVVNMKKSDSSIVPPRALYSKHRKKSKGRTDEIVLHINGFLRASLKIGLGQKVKIDKTACPEAQKVLIAALSPEDKQKVYIDFLIGRPVIRGQIIELQNFGTQDLKVAILTTSPSGIVLVTPNTDVRISHDIPPELSEDVSDDFVMWDDVGGHHETLSRLRSLVENPLRYPEIFEILNINPPQGILITGPAGSGKTYISRALACESGVTRFFVMGTEIVKGWWTTEKEMDKYFQHVIKYEPAIVIIDQIEVLAPAPSPNHSDLEKRMTQRLIQNLDELVRGRKVIVIGTTIDAKLLHPALRVSGRFEVEIPIRVPNYDDRLEILSIHTRGMPLSDVDLREIARSTGGYTPADLELLVKEAGMHTLERKNLLDLEISETPTRESIKSHFVKVNLVQNDFLHALTTIKPSASREIITEIPNITWEDIGGLEEVKQSLREMIEWPIKNPELFFEMGIRAPRGVLLYGPPGTGKTLLAKALANEIEANFLVVKGPELLSKWFSESARMIRELFRRARQLAPCIIFFDEIDALATPRGGAYSSDSSRERDRIINQLLASMDGMERMKGVYIVGATNRPNAIDPAILRPGRLDRLIYVGIPDIEGRKKILKVHTKKMSLDSNVDLQELAQLTQNYTGADLENLCRESAYAGLRRDISTRIVTNEDFQTALKVCRPSITDEIVRYYKIQVNEMKKHRTSEYTRFPEEFL
ncbi:MAG: AAA family ATPase [Candidatus Hodarchaeota archaeon]